MIDKVFSVTGNKITSFIIDEDSLKFSSSTFETVDEFKLAFDKKLSLATKVEIKYNAIKSIKKEDNSSEISIVYKSALGISMDCEFAFTDTSKNQLFFIFLEKERFFSKQYQTLSPIRAVRNHLIGLLAIIGVTIFCYYQAINIANGTKEKTYNIKEIIFYKTVEILGDKGVIAIGLIISGLLVYKIWQRFTNPPNQVVFLPPLE